MKDTLRPGEEYTFSMPITAEGDCVAVISIKYVNHTSIHPDDDDNNIVSEVFVRIGGGERIKPCPELGNGYGYGKCEFYTLVRSDDPRTIDVIIGNDWGFDVDILSVTVSMTEPKQCDECGDWLPDGWSCG